MGTAVKRWYWKTVNGVRKKVPTLAVWDSVGCSPPDRYTKTPPDEEARVGEIARLNTIWFQSRIMGLLRRSGTTLMIINHLRDNLNFRNRGGTPWRMPGGRILRYMAGVTVMLDRGQKITASGHKPGDDSIGVRITATVVKSKISPEHRNMTYALYYDRGIDDVMSVIDYLIDEKYLVPNGAWYSWGGHKYYRTGLWEQARQDAEMFADMKAKAAMLYDGKRPPPQKGPQEGGDTE